MYKYFQNLPASSSPSASIRELFNSFHNFRLSSMISQSGLPKFSKTTRSVLENLRSISFSPVFYEFSKAFANSCVGFCYRDRLGCYRVWWEHFLLFAFVVRACVRSYAITSNCSAGYCKYAARYDTSNKKLAAQTLRGMIL